MTFPFRAMVAITVAACASWATAAATAGDLAEMPPPHIGPCGFAPGAYQLPGTDGCLRLSGFVRAEASALPMPAVRLSTPVPAAATTGFAVPGLARSAIGADARLNADVRIPTEYGPARVFVSLRGGNGSLASRR